MAIWILSWWGFQVVWVAICWIGAYVINAAATARLPLFSDMVVFMSYAMHGCWASFSWGALHRSSRTMVSAKRINQVLDLHSSIKSCSKCSCDRNLKGRSSLGCDLPLCVANSEAVIGIGFRAEAGQTVAFIGSAGSVNLLWSILIPVSTMYQQEKF